MSAYGALSYDMPQIARICEQLFAACKHPDWERLTSLADELYDHIYELYQTVYERPYYYHLPSPIFGLLRHLFRVAQSYKKGALDALTTVREIRSTVSRLHAALLGSRHEEVRRLVQQMQA